MCVESKKRRTYVLTSHLSCLLRRPERGGGGTVVDCGETFSHERGGKVLAVDEQAPDEAAALVRVVDRELDIALQKAACGERSCLLAVRVGLLGGVASGPGSPDLREDKGELGVLFRDQDLCHARNAGSAVRCRACGS